MLNAFFKARPRLRAALLGLAVCAPSIAIGATAAFAQNATAATAPAFVSARFSVEVMGAGPDVVFIPGYASSRDVWRAEAERLKGTHRVHLVQLAGFAGEPWSHGDGAFFDPMVAELARYVRQGGLDRPAVIGHSMGGLTAVRLAQVAPDAVGRVMSVDSLPFFGALYGPQATVEMVRPAAERTAQILLASDDDAFREAQEQTAIGMSRDEATRRLMVEWSMASDRQGLAAGIRDVMTTDIRPGLAAMTTPVWAVYASDADGGAPAAMADGVWGREYASLPGVRLERVDDSRHFIMADQPERMAAVIDAFLAD